MKNSTSHSCHNLASNGSIGLGPRLWSGLRFLCFTAMLLILQLVVPKIASTSCSLQSRPIQLGVCGSGARGYCGCLSGTLGSTVKDSSGNQYILSNNHILALYNTDRAGDAIRQPSCGGTQDTVANLTRFIPLSTSGNNSVDAAIAKVVAGKVNTSDSILGIGAVSGTTGCFVNQFVKKQGAGSGLTSGQILFCNMNAFVTDSCSGHHLHVCKSNRGFDEHTPHRRGLRIIASDAGNAASGGTHFRSQLKLGLRKPDRRGA